MKKFKKSLPVLAPSLLWFLILPFPFEGFRLGTFAKYTSWAWLGGYHLFITEFQGIIPIGSPATQEENDSLYHYASHWYLLAFVLCSLALGVITYVALKVLRKPDKSKK